MKTPDKNKSANSSSKKNADLDHLDKELNDLIKENESLKEGMSKILKKIDNNNNPTNSN